MTRWVKFILIVAFGWCAFWWGHSFGVGTAMRSELSSAQTDRALMEAMRAKCDTGCPIDVVDSIGQMKNDRIRLVESSIPRAQDQLLAPVAGPISAWQLARVRAESEDK